MDFSQLVASLKIDRSRLENAITALEGISSSPTVGVLPRNNLNQRNLRHASAS
jgi:hypothetical protein